MPVRRLVAVLSILGVACGGEPADSVSQEAPGVRTTAEPTGASSSQAIRRDSAMSQEPSLPVVGMAGVNAVPTADTTGPQQSVTLPPDCMPIPPPPSGSGDPRIVFQAWCRRPPSEVLQAWRDGDHFVGTYAPRWAFQVCAGQSAWHDELMGYFMELPLQLAYVQQLWMEGLSRAIRDCDDTRAIEWLRAALNTDLAPDAHAVVVTMALSLEEPAWDSLAYAVSENTTRDPEIRMRALELYAQARLEPIELPALIAEAYRSGRLPAGFIDKWVPMLLARPDTRDDMAIRGIDALLAQPGRILPLKGEFASLLFIEVGTYSYRFSEAVRQRSEGALQEIRQNPNRGYALNQALIRIDAARRDSLNAAGFRVRRVPWEFAAMLTPEGCVPIWPDRLRAFAEAEVPDIRLLSRGDDCPGPYAVGDFDADGHDDVVMMAVLDAREVWALVLAGESPRLIEVTSVLGFDSTHLVQPGWFTGACAETGWMPWEGFSISYDEKGNNVFYVRDGALVEQAGDSC